MNTLTSLAIEKGNSYIINSSKNGKSSKDYTNMFHGSDEWITAYVAYQINLSNDPAALAFAKKSWKFLRWRAFFRTGWGYNIIIPADADSTNWGLVLGQSLQQEKSYAFRKNMAYLLKHKSPDGGISTYTKGKIKFFEKLGKGRSFEGWSKSHLCVTSAAALLSDLNDDTQILNYILRNQQSDGRWTGYWWCDDEYTTYYATLALKNSTHYPKATNHAIQWTISELSNPKKLDFYFKSPFAFAFALRTLTLNAKSILDQEIDQLLKILVPKLTSLQKEDGSWQGSARLRVVPPDVVDPDEYKKWKGSGGVGTIKIDIQRLFSTASVIGALSDIKNSKLC